MAFQKLTPEDVASSTVSAVAVRREGHPVIVVQMPDPKHGDNAVKYAATNAARLPRVLTDAQDAFAQASWLPNSDPVKPIITEAAQTIVTAVLGAEESYLDVSHLHGAQGAAVHGLLLTMFDGTYFAGSYANAQKNVMNAKYELLGTPAS